MKKIIAGVAAVLIAVGVAPSAMAQTSIMTGSSPLTNLNPLGATLHLGLSNFPDGKGIYIFEVVKNPTGGRPTIINNDQSSQAWVIANGPAGSTSPMGDIKVVVTATFGGQTCTDNCGLYFEYDHTNSTDTSEDHFVPISFSAAALQQEARPQQRALLSPDRLMALHSLHHNQEHLLTKPQSMLLQQHPMAQLQHLRSLQIHQERHSAHSMEITSRRFQEQVLATLRFMQVRLSDTSHSC